MKTKKHKTKHTTIEVAEAFEQFVFEQMVSKYRNSLVLGTIVSLDNPSIFKPILLDE